MPVDPSKAYSDDRTIPPDELLYRMVTTGMVKFRDDGTVDRLQTNAFQDYPESRLADVGAPAVAMSVMLQSEMVRRGTTVDDLLARWGTGHGIAVVTAGDVRAHGQGIVRWPTERDPEHGMVFALLGSRKTDGQSKKISRCAELIVPPPPPRRESA